ncbi:MAG: 5'-methylthioadenosine/adenosylhomocysteine nucleosidase [Planctomycetota bacterium]
MRTLLDTSSRLGVMTAMPEEIAALDGALEGRRVEHAGLREYHSGRLFGRDVVIVMARVGKVAAASTATQLLTRFDVGGVIMTGLAGGVGEGVRVGDLVIGRETIQHDLDASPLFPRHEAPLLGRSRFVAPEGDAQAATRAAEAFLTHDLDTALGEARSGSLGIDAPRAHAGLIATGDQFFTDNDRIGALRAMLPEALAVEMEGAAVAQVCHEHDTPCLVIRAISDRADAHATEAFLHAMPRIAAAYAIGVLRRLLDPAQRRGQ